MQSVFGPERQVVMARELTKQFETYLSGTVSEVLAQVERDPEPAARGEIVLNGCWGSESKR